MTSIYQHFRTEEKEFVDSVLEWKSQVESQYASKRTDFLDPRQQYIVKSIVGQNEDIQVMFYPETAERKRALLYPPYYHPEEEDFGILLFEMEYPSKFVTIEHRQVLGTLMSLGLKRDKYGDILTHNGSIQLILAEEISDYVSMQFTEVGKTKVSLIPKPIADMVQTNEQWQDKITTVSSLRLDVILSAIYSISRQKAQALIKASLVKVNWRIVENASFVVEEYDVISSRGYGRSKLLSIEGKTKKEKWRISVGVLK
ncbi:YlmH family RNA-binding protein [Rossellomorea aquimaris]|uniref:YlmH family RNA-binding protein n=1 Tax=Rossellomorea aquimaris TaxID=189382 RepID=UPI0007D0AFB7|nr:RNA-binding protein [Rossellomorea aquimaris]